jgi:2-oxoglutarate dehydrogenase E1 component
MYERIKDRPPVHEIYGKQLAEAGVVGEDFVTEEENKRQSELESAFDVMQNNHLVYPKPKFFENWKGYTGAYTHDPVETAVSAETLASFAETLNSAPEGFSLHSKLERLFKKRREAVDTGEGIDWANAESLAFASILQDGDPIRISGQDCGRGTFSQRHAVIHDTKTGEVHVPLNTLGEGQGRFSVHNSLLSEAGVLGYEYGYAAAQPRGLTIWEAQFGDFANNAQSIIDLYITSGEIKWHRPCGLTMLLPHGMEGLGPEHSSARMERFLQLCAGNNIQVVNPTTPAQYFHLLRRQALASYRKPLIVMTPKSLLRHPEAVSNTTDFTEGTFQSVLSDTSPDFSTDPENVERVLLLSGKIYYELVKRRRDLESTDAAILRIEQIYPFPEEALQAAMAPYKNAKQWFWVQEEPENMGAWTFLRPRLESVIGDSLTYIGRNPSPTPATGFANIYRQVQSRILDTAVGQSPKTKRGQHIVSG